MFLSLSFPRRRESGNEDIKLYYVYILTNKKDGVLYTGVTSDLTRRVYEHKNGLVDGFTKKYKVKNLVYIEEYKDSREAIHREKCIKKWNRSWKINLIENMNPNWENLYNKING